MAVDDKLPGWFGEPQHLDSFLSVVGADRDPATGQWLIGVDQGNPDASVTRGLDGSIVIGPRVVYFVGGRAAGLASGLRGTSYGMSVMVI